MKWVFILVFTCMYSASDVTSQNTTQSEHVSPTTSIVHFLYIEPRESFSLWCNFSTSIDLSTESFSIRWVKDDTAWCTFKSGKVNEMEEECVRRGITPDNVYNPSGTQNFQLNIQKANKSDSGNYTCAMRILDKDNSIMLPTIIIVLVKERITPPVSLTIPPSLESSSKDPAASAGISTETVIAIGAGGGGGVLLITIIIVAVVCVKKNSKGNSTSDINQKKVTYRKSYPVEENAENIDDWRKSNPLEKNIENIHYADLTLHDNPKSPSSKGTGSAKSKTLTVNPSDERVEYAAVMAS